MMISQEFAPTAFHLADDRITAVPEADTVGAFYAGLGNEDAFPRPRLSARCRFRQGTFGGMHGSDGDAPISAIRGAAMEPRASTKSAI
jgi:hypothetical protein